MGYHYEMKKKILLIGSSGHLASNFIEKYEKKFQIYNFTRSISKKKLLTKKFKYSIFFLQSQIPSFLKKINFESLIFFAGPNDVECNLKKEDILSSFFKNTFNFLENISEIKFKKAIYVSTAQIYELKNIVNEYTKPNPQNYYGLSRLINENLFLYYFNKRKIPLTILRPSNIVGDAKFDKKNSNRLLPNQLCDFFLRNNHFKLKSSGKNIKNFLSMNDTIDCLSFLIRKKIKKEFLIFNLGNRNMTVLNFSKLIAKVFSNKTGIKKIVERGKKDNNFYNMTYIDNKIRDLGFKKRENLQKKILEMYNGRIRQI